MKNTLLLPLTPQALDDWKTWLREVTDIPSAPAPYHLPLNHVGVSKVRVPLRLNDFADPLLAVVDATTSLAPEQRGIHMSRLVEAIFEASRYTFRHQVEFVNALAAQAQQNQGAHTAHIAVTAEGFTNSTTAHTTKASKEPLMIQARSERSGETLRTYHGVRLHILTACPCTQTHFRYELARTIADLTDLQTANVILPHLRAQTHVQRGVLDCEVEDHNGLISALELTSTLEGAVTRVRGLLKRADEHALVEDAHRKAQFTEDVVRDAAVSLVPLLNRLPLGSTVRLRASAEESIHPHNAEAILFLTVEEIIKRLGADVALPTEITALLEECDEQLEL